MENEPRADIRKIVNNIVYVLVGGFAVFTHFARDVDSTCLLVPGVFFLGIGVLGLSREFIRIQHLRENEIQRLRRQGIIGPRDNPVIIDGSAREVNEQRKKT